MIRFICVCIVVIGYLILSIPILLVEWVIGKFNKRAKDISSLRIIQAVFRFILKITGADITVKGHENVPADTAVLYIGNHRSFFDILLTYVLCPDVTGYVAKKEMESIPLLSIWMRYLHCLFLDRKNIKEGMKTILLAIEEMKKGISICIFPEGTRSKMGNEMLEFKGGSFKAATKAKCPIVPVVLYDSFKPFEGKSFRKVITQLHFLPPIPYETFADMKTYEIRDMVVSLIQNQLDKMESLNDW